MVLAIGVVDWGRRWGGINEVWPCSLAFVWGVFWCGWGGGGCFLITCSAATFACSYVNYTYRYNMSSALSTTSSLSSICSSIGVGHGSFSVIWFSTGSLIPREARCWVRVWSYARRSAFALLRVVFVGGHVSLVSGGVVVGWGGGVGISLMIVVCGFFVCRLFFNPSMSISAFFTAITIGVCAVAVSKFSMYRKRFLWFSTLKFTPATISKKSTVFFSFVIIGWSSSASESSSSEWPTFFLFFCLLLRGSLLHAAS